MRTWRDALVAVLTVVGLGCGGDEDAEQELKAELVGIWTAASSATDNGEVRHVVTFYQDGTTHWQVEFQSPVGGSATAEEEFVYEITNDGALKLVSTETAEVEIYLLDMSGDTLSLTSEETGETFDLTRVSRTTGSTG